MDKENNEELVENFLDNIRYLSIAHHVAGRIRIKAGWDAVKKLGDIEPVDIERAIAAIPGIVNYRVNKKALSVIVEYDIDILPYSLWEEVGGLRENPLNREKVKKQLLEILQRQHKES